MLRSLRKRWGLALALVLTGAAPAEQPGYQPPRHAGPPAVLRSVDQNEAFGLADEGFSIEHRRDPADALAEHRRLDAALATLQPQRKGVADAYVLSVALDSDPVFGREAREAGRVLSRRYGAEGHSLVLAGSDGTAPSGLPRGSPANIDTALARIAELMDPSEDVLVLYFTAHGGPMGVVYNDGDQGYGYLSPVRLALVLDALGIRRRLLIISACYSGVFVPALGNADSAVLTAASSDRTSFGCASDNDWTFFGDAMINHALRKAQPLDAAAREAKGLIEQWEAKGKLIPSQPQSWIGDNARTWLAALDRVTPRQPGAPVGRPAVTLLDER